MGMKEGITLLAIFTIAFIIFFLPTRSAYWWDECVYMQNARTLLGWKNYEEFFVRPPFLSVLLAVGFAVYDNALIAKGIVATLGALGSLGLYFIGKRQSKLAGIVSSLLWIFSPFIAENGRTVMTGVPATAMLIWAYYFLLEGKYLASGILAALAMLTRFPCYFFLSIPLIYFIIEKDRKISLFFAGVLVTFLPYFIWISTKYGFARVMLNAINAAAYSPKSWLYYIQILPKIFSWPVIALAAFQAIKDKKKEKFLLIAWFLIYLLAMMRIPHKEPRYLLPLSPPVFILASEAISSIKPKVLAALLLSLIIINPALRTLEPLKYPFRTDYKSNEMIASEVILELNKTKIYANVNGPVFAYYTGLKTFAGKIRGEYFEYYDGFKGVKIPLVDLKDCVLVNYPEMENVSDAYLENLGFELVKKIGPISIFLCP